MWADAAAPRRRRGARWPSPASPGSAALVAGAAARHPHAVGQLPGAGPGPRSPAHVDAFDWTQTLRAAELAAHRTRRAHVSAQHADYWKAEDLDASTARVAVAATSAADRVRIADPAAAGALDADDPGDDPRDADHRRDRRRASRPAARTSPRAIAPGGQQRRDLDRRASCSARATATASPTYSPAPDPGTAASRRDRLPAAAARRTTCTLGHPGAAAGGRRLPAGHVPAVSLRRAARSSTARAAGPSAGGCSSARRTRARLRAGPPAGRRRARRTRSWRASSATSRTASPTTRTRRCAAYPLESFLFRDRRLLPAVRRRDGAAAADGRRPRARGGGFTTGTLRPATHAVDGHRHRRPRLGRGVVPALRLGPVRPDAGGRPGARAAAAAAPLDQEPARRGRQPRRRRRGAELLADPGRAAAARTRRGGGRLSAARDRGRRCVLALAGWRRWSHAGVLRPAPAASELRRRARAGAAPLRPPARRRARRWPRSSSASAPRRRPPATCARCAWRATAARGGAAERRAAPGAARAAAPASAWPAGCAPVGAAARRRSGAARARR